MKGCVLFVAFQHAVWASPFMRTLSIMFCALKYRHQTTLVDLIRETENWTAT